MIPAQACIAIKALLCVCCSSDSHTVLGLLEARYERINTHPALLCMTWRRAFKLWIVGTSNS